MNIISSKEYQDKITEFCKKNTLVKVETTAFDCNGYTKWYICEKGTLTEVNRWVYVPVEVRGVKTSVQLLEHEQYSTDDSKSYYFYEK